ncbi:MAG: hypothetical protein GX055_11430 [Desulfovibrionales bacterium]|nr:hypothetical protein [Desulfovibrionales bacterium]
MAERVFSIVTRPDTGLALYECVRDHVRTLHDQGLSTLVGYDVMSNGRVILLKVRGPEPEKMPSEDTVNTVLAEDFVQALEALAQELVDGFYAPSFAHCASEENHADPIY